MVTKVRPKSTTRKMPRRDPRTGLFMKTVKPKGKATPKAKAVKRVYTAKPKPRPKVATRALATRPKATTVARAKTVAVRRTVAKSPARATTRAVSTRSNSSVSRRVARLERGRRNQATYAVVALIGVGGFIAYKYRAEIRAWWTRTFGQAPTPAQVRAEGIRQAQLRAQQQPAALPSGGRPWETGQDRRYALVDPNTRTF